MGLKGGVLVGTIGGLVGGVINLIEIYWIQPFPEMIDYVPLTVNTAGGMMIIAIIAGIIFGASYAKFYPHLWGRGLIKGVYCGILLMMYYGFLLMVITIIELFLGVNWTVNYLEKSIWHFVLGRLFMWVACGVTIGVLYERIDRRDDIG